MYSTQASTETKLGAQPQPAAMALFCSRVLTLDGRCARSTGRGARLQRLAVWN